LNDLRLRLRLTYIMVVVQEVINVLLRNGSDSELVCSTERKCGVLYTRLHVSGWTFVIPSAVVNADRTRPTCFNDP